MATRDLCRDTFPTIESRSLKTTSARWVFPEVDQAREDELARALGVSALAARILVKRGYGSPEQAAAFLRPSLDALHDPFRMKGMREAAARIARAVREREPVLLYGDYDVDGTTSIVILKRVLELAGAVCDFHVPHRLKDGYGMQPEAIRAAADAGTKLVVSVDTGIRAAEVVRYARELGVDVVVTDHHLPEAELPPAHAVLNPTQPGCEYPDKNLCGAGVAFKLAQALLAEMPFDGARARRLTLSLLKLVAIATVADVVPLTGENRVIVKHGLSGLGESPNPGLRALLDVAGFAPGDVPTAGQVAFRIAPRINAAGRMASARDVIEMFLTSDGGRAKELAKQLDVLNQDRQDAEQHMLRQAIEVCDERPVDESRRGLVFAGKDWHRGVAGIVASRLVERFWRPVFVLSIDEEAGEAVGSGRSAGGFHLLEALEAMPDVFRKFGGHKQAAGVTLPLGKLGEFERRFNEYACARLAPEDLCARYEVDAVARVDEMRTEVVRDVLAMGPFGCGNPQPIVAVRGALLPEPPSLMKERHVKFRLVQGDRLVLCKGWNWGEQIERLPSGVMLDALLALEEDSYSAWSAVLKDVRTSE